MTKPNEIQFVSADFELIKSFKGSIALTVPEDGSAGPFARELDSVCGGQVSRYLGSPDFADLKFPGLGVLGYPSGCAAQALIVSKIPADATRTQLRQIGTRMAIKSGDAGVVVLSDHADDPAAVADVAFGIALGRYSFDRYRTKETEGKKGQDTSMLAVAEDPAGATELYRNKAAVVQGVFAARDLVNEPANVLTTTEFAQRMEQYRDIGLLVSVLDEEELERIGMRTLLAVGEGSATPSKVVIMEWRGASGPPLALIGKGVVFDTGGISIKPASRMEEMTMDMAGAATVAGVMKTLALRNSPAHVIGALGLVENMPGGKAQRPGDVVKSLKGDTVEVINTDAEGRLVLADLLWHIQESYEPAAMIDLATLTGAIIVGLGDELAGVFSNDDDLAGAFLDAAKREDEGAWRMPLHDPYDKLLKSRVADIRNVGGRGAGAVTAAQFLKHFVKPDCPWIHLDIAGVAYSGGRNGTLPKGATGWGVQSINRLIEERFEPK